MTASVDAPLISEQSVKRGVLACAHDIGLVTHLQDGFPKTVPELARLVQEKEDVVHRMVTELCALGFCSSRKMVDSGEVGFLWDQGAPDGSSQPTGYVGPAGDVTFEFGQLGLDNQPLPKQGPYRPYIHNYSMGWPPMMPYVQPPVYMYSMMPSHQPVYAQNGVFPGQSVHPAVEVRDITSSASSSGMLTPKSNSAYKGFHVPDSRSSGAAGAPSTGWEGIPLQTQPVVPSSPTSGTVGTPDSEAASDKDSSKKCKDTNADARAPCAFFLKTGTCAYGDRCKFDHPLDRVPIIQFNTIGLPVRPGEPDCSFYMKNLRCGFGASCKFNHPEPYIAWGMPPAALAMHNSMMPWYGVPYSSAVPGGAPMSNVPGLLPPSTGRMSPAQEMANSRGMPSHNLAGSLPGSSSISPAPAGQGDTKESTLRSGDAPEGVSGRVGGGHIGNDASGAAEGGGRVAGRQVRGRKNGRPENGSMRKDKPIFKNGRNGSRMDQQAVELLADRASNEAGKAEGDKRVLSTVVAAH